MRRRKEWMNFIGCRTNIIMKLLTSIILCPLDFN